MEVVTAKQYFDEKQAFFEEHHFDYKIETSELFGNSYRKTYLFADGSAWYERNEKVKKEVEVEIYGMKTTTIIPLFKVEYWTSSNSTSKCYYEKY